MSKSPVTWEKSFHGEKASRDCYCWSGQLTATKEDTARTKPDQETEMGKTKSSLSTQASRVG